jgi:DNA repair protein RadC
MPTKRTRDKGQQLREALTPYVDLRHLRTIVARGGAPQQALLFETADQLPCEITILIDALSTLLQPNQRERITSPQDVAGMLMVEMGRLEQEELRVVLLNTKNEVMQVVCVYRGSLTSAPVRVAEVFKEAIRCNAFAIIIAHNHPSGDPSPSAEDVAVTREIVEAGKLLGIDVLDHLVIGQGRWASLRERGLGFR